MNALTSVSAEVIMANGTSGKTRKFTKGAEKEKKPNVVNKIGKVISCAANVLEKRTAMLFGNHENHCVSRSTRCKRPKVAKNDN